MIYIDTPMTNDRVVIIDGNPWVNAPFARSLEHKLNAANHRIKLLEAVVNDPHALWVNWLRGDVKLPVGIGDVREYQDRIKQLEEQLMDTKNKHAVLVADVVLNEDRADRIKRLEEAFDTLICVIGLTPIKGNLAALQEAFDMARAVLKAKEDKP